MRMRDKMLRLMEPNLAGEKERDEDQRVNLLLARSCGPYLSKRNGKGACRRERKKTRMKIDDPATVSLGNRAEDENEAMPPYLIRARIDREIGRALQNSQ